MHPQSLATHAVSSVEIFLGIMSVALTTGAMFARFSRPRARFLFARTGIVRPIEGRPTLMFRAANARQNIIMEADARLRLMRDHVTPEGYRIRRIEDLPLVRSQHPVFLLGWNLMHVIDGASPLVGEDAQTLAAARAVFLLSLSGTDETTGQVLMARTEYGSGDVHWNHAYRDVLRTDAKGVEHLDYEHFHHVEPLAAAAPVRQDDVRKIDAAADPRPGVRVQSPL
jgi:inward rectifier potassium channel